MDFRTYILKFAYKVSDGVFHCELCDKWINEQRWAHFRDNHRYEDKKISPKQAQLGDFK